MTMSLDLENHPHMITDNALENSGASEEVAPLRRNLRISTLYHFILQKTIIRICGRRAQRSAANIRKCSAPAQTRL